MSWPRDGSSFPEPLPWNGEPGALRHDDMGEDEQMLTEQELNEMELVKLTERVQMLEFLLQIIVDAAFDAEQMSKLEFDY